MIKDHDLLDAFESEKAGELSLTVEKAYRILDAMWQEGVSLGVLPPEDHLEGIEIDIRLAKAINSCSRRF